MINLTFGLFAQVSNSDAPYFQQVVIIFFYIIVRPVNVRR